MNAIVTGSSRGIGKAIALRLAAGGAALTICARDEHALDEVAAAIRLVGGSALAFPVDLRGEAAGAAVVEAAVQRFGGVDVLVNNAGATKRGDFEALTDADFVDGFALKYFGAVRLVRAAWPHLKKSSGSVINIAGTGGKTPGAQFTIGGSVNAALLSFTKAMAEQGITDGVQVNAINPGPVRTERLSKRLAPGDEEAFVRAERITRIGEPEDIAAMVAFLLSPAGRLMQGSLIDMDGGQTKSL
jgi:NAD(P)-dependent dehydrogenase (short-subunit alcohol dehydrogenase family)